MRNGQDSAPLLYAAAFPLASRPSQYWVGAIAVEREVASASRMDAPWEGAKRFAA